MNSPLRTAVIGLGFFGSLHSRIYFEHSGSQLVAVCDIDFNRAREIAEKTGATPFNDFEAMLNEISIDAVSVCMPDRMHEKAAIAVARAGKAMLLEKPLAHNTAAAGRIVDAVDAAGTRLMVGHVLRFDPRYASVHAASSPEILGDVVHLRAERTGIRATAKRLGDSSSILFYMGVHDVDAMQWIGRSRIARVYAQKRKLLGNGNEDSLFAVVNFENGAIGSIAYSWAWPNGLMNGYRAALEIVGTKSAAFLDCADQGFYAVGNDTVTGGDTHLWPEVNGRITGDLANEIAHFVEATHSGAPYIQDYREAFDAIPVIEGLARSAELGDPVEVRR